MLRIWVLIRAECSLMRELPVRCHLIVCEVFGSKYRTCRYFSYSHFGRANFSRIWAFTSFSNGLRYLIHVIHDVLVSGHWIWSCQHRQAFTFDIWWDLRLWCHKVAPCLIGCRRHLNSLGFRLNKFFLLFLFYRQILHWECLSSRPLVERIFRVSWVRASLPQFRNVWTELLRFISMSLNA